MKKLLKDLARVLSMQFIVLLLIIGLSAIVYFFRKDILISYHRWGQESSLKSMSKNNTPTSREKNKLYTETLKRHQDALINLGYLEKRTFNTKYLSAITPEMEKVTVEFSKRHPGCTYSIGWSGGYEIIIVCPTDMMPAWEELIKKNDVPPNDPNKG